MSSIHYKFRSSTEYDTIAFEGQAISLSDLREAIMLQKKIVKSPAYTLEITNAQTKEVYGNDNTLVPKNSSVIIKRVPVQRLAAVTDGAGLTKEEEELTEMAFAKLSTTANLANANASEDDKIKAMIRQSTEDFDPSTYQKRAPPTYICHRCGGKGHYLKHCPTLGDPRYNKNTFQRPPSGIPREYILIKMKQEEEIINSLRAMQDKNSRFSPAVGSDPVDHAKVPENLQCPMCHKLFTDAVVTPCCGESYCDECIRNYLIEHDLTCNCGETTSPDNLIANKSMRITVDNFRNNKKADMKSVPPSPVGQQLPSSVAQPLLSIGQPQPQLSVANGPALLHLETHQPSQQAMLSNEMFEIQPLQAPPELNSESSQSSFTNGGLVYTNMPSPQIPGIMNSPQKPHIEKDELQPLSQVTHSLSAQHLLADAQHFMTASITPAIIQSQAFSSGPTTAIYTQGMHSHAGLQANYVLPSAQTMLSQPILGPGAIQYGVNLPTGATIVKRLVPVPVGPRLVPQGVPQPPIYGPSGLSLEPPLVDIPPRSRSRKDKKLESPMPMSEDEFYSIQNKLFKKKPRFRGSRSRSPSLDRRRHRYSASPDRRYDSEESSQERLRRKEKSKRRRRDSSQESSRSDSNNKKRSDKKYSTLKRHIPKHIKREVEEFEFDNELEFDEELRKLRNTSKSNDIEDDEDLFSPKGKSRSHSTSPLQNKSRSVTKSPKLKPDPLTEKMLDNVSQAEPDEEKNTDATTVTEAPLENGGEVIPKKKTRIVKKVVKRVIKVKKSELAARKIGETIAIAATAELPSPTGLVKQENKVFAENIAERTETNVDNRHEEHSSPEKAETQEDVITDSKIVVNEKDLPENSRWETGYTSTVAKRKTLTTSDNSSHIKKAKSESDLVKNKSEIANKNLTKHQESNELVEDKSKVSPEGKRDPYKRALMVIEKAKKTLLKEKTNATTDEELDRVRKKEKYLIFKEKQIKEKHKQRLRKEAHLEIMKSHKRKDQVREDDSKTKLTNKPDQGGDAKLKTLSEMSKKTLKETETPKNISTNETGEGDVLKSKVTSLRKVITVPEKSSIRPEKISISEEENVSQSSDDRLSRRIVKIDEKKKSIVSRVSEKSKHRPRSQDQENNEEKWRHEKSLERERQEVIERERLERKRRLREEEYGRRREKEIERERLQHIERKRLKAEMEKEESYERERQALREKERLARKLQQERQLREELMREKEEEERRRRKEESDKKRKVWIKHNGDSDEQIKNKNKGKSVINIDVSESEDDEESSEEEKEKKKKKRSKKKKERKKKRKREDSEADEEDEDSDEVSTEERTNKKKKKKHRKKHRKKSSKKSRKHKKKNKKKAKKKGKSESESDADVENDEEAKDDEKETEDGSVDENKEEDGSADDNRSDSSDVDSEQSAADQKEDTDVVKEEKTKKESSKRGTQALKSKEEESTENSTTTTTTEDEDNSGLEEGGGEKVTKEKRSVKEIADGKSSKSSGEETCKKTAERKAISKDVSENTNKNKANAEGESENTEEMEEKEEMKKVSRKKVRSKSANVEGEGEELDYNEDLGDIDDDVLYGDLNFADDEQVSHTLSSKDKNKSKDKDEDCEEGEILDDELFVTTNSKHNAANIEIHKYSQNGENHKLREPTETDIENAVNDAMDKLLDDDLKKVLTENAPYQTETS